MDLADPALAIGVPEQGNAARAWLPSLPEQLPGGAFTPALAPVLKIIASGGSTGQPKLIVTPAPALSESVAQSGVVLGLRPDGCVLTTGPLAHNGPFTTTVAAAVLGNHVVLTPRFDAGQTLGLIERHQVTWAWLVPTMMLRIWRLPEAERLGADVSSIQAVMHGAAPCPAWLKHAWIDWLGAEKVLELYGAPKCRP